MKKHLITLLTLLFALPTVWASSFTYHITQEQTVLEIQSGLQAAINNNEQVIVVGSKTNADQTLALEIATGKTVVWQAVYQSIGTFSATALLSISGTGTFEVAEGAQITGAAEELITSEGDNATVAVSGGNIIATWCNAIVTYGKNAKILISGGYLCNNADGNYPAIIAWDPRPNSEAQVHVSGNAKIEAKGKGSAIISTYSVKISGTAHVSNAAGGDDAAAILGYYKVEITDNAKVTASNNNAISSYFDVSVSGNSVVEAKENAIAINIIYPNGKVEIKDNAQVIAAQNYAIYTKGWFNISIIGGMVFSYGTNMDAVINDESFTGPTGTGVVLAWDKQAGNIHYEKQSKEDIFVSPATATAHWEVIGGKAGIYYANGSNTGFIPLEVSVLSIHEPVSLGFEVYPNPTSGELQVTSYELQMNNEKLIMNNIELFDIYGRKQNVEFHSYGLTILQSYGLSTLPAGIYFLRVGNEMKRVVKL